jgi:hypothetical protein
MPGIGFNIDGAFERQHETEQLCRQVEAGVDFGIAKSKASPCGRVTLSG